MLKAFDVMAQDLAICTPETNIVEVTAMMRGRNIGSVMVVEDGKVCGIVTDRDLALQALTGKDDPNQTPVRKFMSSKVVTADANWNLEKVSKVMAKKQIRRLPILMDGNLVGIITLGDIARYMNRKGTITKSLKAVSTPKNSAKLWRRRMQTGAAVGIGLAALATTAIAWLALTHSGQTAE